MTTSIALAVFLAAAIGVGLILKKKRTTPPGKPEAPAPSQPVSSSPEQEFTKILDVLLNLNLMIRKDPTFDQDRVVKVEEIIDDLKAIIPAMMDRYPGETLTYEIKKIGLTHLHKTVKEFLDLSPDSRQRQNETFLAILQSLHEVTHRSRDIVEKNETAEFKTMAHFLAGKFS